MSDIEMPMPGDRLSGSTVVASVYYGDDQATLLLLNEQAPYYTVVIVALNAGLSYPWTHHGGDHLNIIAAVRDYEQCGGDF